MNIRLFTNKSLLNQAQFMWKTLVVLILSVLLFAPTPVLALDYNGTLQSYVSNVKVELDGILPSLTKLPNLSYENGQTTLAEIDSKLQKIQTDAGKRAADFQELSDKAQKESNQLLDEINKLYPSQQALEMEVQENAVKLREVENEIKRIQKAAQKPGTTVDNQLIARANELSNYFKRTQSELLLLQSRLKPLKESRAKLESDNQRLSEGIVLTNKISKLCDDLEKRINLATQKLGNVKEYVDALKSFSDPDVLNEIGELNQFVADLTNNLPNGN